MLHPAVVLLMLILFVAAIFLIAVPNRRRDTWSPWEGDDDDIDLDL